MSLKANPDKMVTVLCITYNHESFIGDCLEGIVRQETDFPYEAIVHDDASTDGTADIIREYARRYPEIIHPIIEQENQFSQGFGAPKDLVTSMAFGKYIAICEGDDYWIDRHKLQTQFDFMEANPDYALCLHNAIISDFKHGIDYLSEPQKADRDKTCEEIILEGGGVLNPTASFFLRADKEFPPIAHHCSANDHFEMIKLASRGKVRWMAKPMSVYRWCVDGSWTQRQALVTPDQARLHIDSRIDALRTYDEATHGAYHRAFEKRIAIEESKFEPACRQYELMTAPSVPSALFKTAASASEKLKYLARVALPQATYAALLKERKRRQALRQGAFVASRNQSYLDRLQG